ncbi:MAG: FAD-dependent oxidoreductase [Gordonia sp. (in: high G+C Gram-positive bacteria)]
MRVTTDVVLIGGGVLGTLLAFELSFRGISVVVLERDDIGRQGSGTTAGNLHIQAIHTRRPAQQASVDCARLVPLQHAASTLWDTFAQRAHVADAVFRCGGFTVAESEQQVEDLYTKLAWERQEGIPTEVVGGDELRTYAAYFGKTIRAATWCPWDGYADSLSLMPRIASQAARMGARIFTGSPVVGISRTANAWNIDSHGVSVSAGAVINASGPWIADICRLAGIDIAMSPLAIQMHESVRTERFLRHIVQHIGVGLSVKQTVAGSLVIGGGWPAGRLNPNGSAPVLDESVTGNLSDAARVIPRAGGVRLARVWSGPLAATPDEMPLVGEIPGHRGMFVVGGTYAFTFAPLWAKVMSDLVQGSRAHVDIDDLGPGRLLAREEAEIR